MFTFPAVEEPLAWIENRIDLSFDGTSAVRGLVHLDAWQREPIRCQFDPAVREVVIVAIEQIGKSTCWRLPMAYKMIHQPGPRWVIYESDEKAEDINRRSLDPLLRSLPEINHLLNRKTATRRAYHLANGAITDFSGAGADITSKPVLDGVADELDRWGPVEFTMQNLRNFRKRFRTFWRRDKGCLVVATSPKTEGGMASPVWELFEETDQGFWTLRCQECGRLSIRSCDIYRLQWELDEGEHIVEDSIRLVCPKCGHQHTEDQAQEMTDSGGYVSRDPKIIKRRGFQVGSLGVPRVFRWADIAEAQMAAGRSASVKAQSDFDNSWRGLPFSPRRVHKPTVDALKKRREAGPAADEYANLFFAADTQDNGWWWLVFGVTARECVHVLRYGFIETLDYAALDEVWNAEYLPGVRCEMGIIDEGGHHGRAINEWCAERPGLYSYKGNPRIGKDWKLSDTEPNRLLAQPARYQAELLYLLYTQTRRDSSYLTLPIENDAQDSALLEHLASLQPDNAKKAGHRYENWTAKGDDHLFDALKMGLVLFEYARSELLTWRVPVPWLAVDAEPDPRKAGPIV